MKRLKFLLLDADVVIKIFELGLWDQIIEHCDIHISRTIIENEALYYKSGEIHERINLTPHKENKIITEVDIQLSELNDFRNKFGLNYLDRLHSGETESLAYLNTKDEPFLLCSADKIVFRVLPQLNRAEQGISLEEVLQQVGLGRSLEKHFTKAYREIWTKKGQEEMIRGIGLK